MVPFCRDVPLKLKIQKTRDKEEIPKTLGEPIRKRRRELGLLQREATVRLRVSTETVVN